MQQTTMACVYLRNKPAHSAYVSQNLKYNNNKIRSIRMAFIKKNNKRVNENAEKSEHLYIAGGDVN